MKFKNKYRSESHRSRGWNYGGKGKYFVTILTKYREPYFGEVKPGQKDDADSKEVDSQFGNPYVTLSEIGTIVQDFWLEIPKHFPFVTLDEYIIMPDHIHGILFFHTDPVNTPDPGVSDPGVSDPGVSDPGVSDPGAPDPGVSDPGVPDPGVPNPHTSSLTPHRSRWQPGTLGVVINQYKRICKIHARKIIPNFNWHRNYHDTIIHNDQQLNRIRSYIKNNPRNWDP